MQPPTSGEKWVRKSDGRRASVLRVEMSPGQSERVRIYYFDTTQRIAWVKLDRFLTDFEKEA